jgi:hypothetical protein
MQSTKSKAAVSGGEATLVESRTKRRNREIAERTAALPKIPKALLEGWVREGPMTALQINEATVAFRKALIESALGGELTHHLGYAPGQQRPEGELNARNGVSGKTVKTDAGALRIEVPRDRDGSFDPLLIGKHERRFTGFDDKIIAMYARGMSVREIQGFLREQYEVEVSPDFISSVTDAVIEEVRAWQARPLDRLYPVVFFDALRVKIRADGVWWLTARCIWRLVWPPTALATFWVCGLRARTGRSSGSKSSTI